jgi:asparagine synthase (glutamine-hydrolysing)
VVSGLVGILNFDGSPAPACLLERLTKFLSSRGPDAQDVWVDGPVGLGHTLLQVSAGHPREKQPAQLDGRLWIVADARIDSRTELIDKLRTKTRNPGALCRSTPDAELILRAYDAWGEGCVEHLLGDFSFAIWDARQRRLFCARDHFGFRLFFYARTGNSLVFSNTLDCLRLYPRVSDRLDDLAIADFLLFESNQDLATSAFGDIKRLPPAHTLSCDRDGITVSRYWKLPEAAPVRYGRAQEYLDAFREIFDSAVSDRLRGTTAGLHLSGGLDSSAVAISARRIADQRGGTVDLRGFTHFHEELIPHEEKHYAGLVGRALRIPIEFLNGDNCHVYDVYDDPDFRTPEPIHPVMGYRNANPAKEIAAFSRTALAGYGGDPALASLLSEHFKRLFRGGKYLQMLFDILGYLTAEGRLSRLYLRTRFQRWFGHNAPEEFPEWLNPDLVRRFDLKARWDAFLNEDEPNHSARPEAYSLVASKYWTHIIESEDASISGFQIDVGYPFFDLRVLKFLLGLPALPWSSDKQILRQAAHGILPEEVRLRKKSPLIRDPIEALLQRPESAWVDRFQPVPELESFVIRKKIPRVFKTGNTFGALLQLRPLSLNFWLQRRSIGS